MGLFVCVCVCVCMCVCVCVCVYIYMLVVMPQNIFQSVSGRGDYEVAREGRPTANSKIVTSPYN